MPEPITNLLPGDPAPWFIAATAANPGYSFASVAGRYVLLACTGPAAAPGTAAALATLEAARAAGLLDDANAAAFLAVPQPPGEGAPADQIPGLRIFHDPELAIARRYGLLRREADGRAAFTPAAFLLDPLLRVLATAPLAELGALLARLRSLPPASRHAGAESPAPVLLLPRVFEPSLCRRLIDEYETAGGTESGFMVAREGRTVGVYDHAQKRRRDCVITDPALQAAIRGRVERRLLPEIRKAFQFEATRIERYMVARYDGAEGGHFAAHRDNTTPGTAHRRFAVTINLNEEFEGGGLRFPEFGPRLYRPPAGGAVVFSCSLLHEAVPVARGVRYATLPFLYDDAAARLRDANAATVVAGVPPS